MRQAVDIIDRAQELEEAEREAAIRRHRSLSASTAASGDCIDCGDPIPLARRKAAPAACRCIWCQQESERRTS